MPTTSSPLAAHGAAWPFAGREVELRLIADRLEATIGGAGGTLVVAGPAGIGKSRLVREALAGVPVATRIAVAHASEAERHVPFALLVNLHAPLAVVDVDLVLDRPPSGDAGWDRLRYLEAAVDRIAAGATDAAPLILVVEDVQWADEGSLELLLRLSRRTATRPLFLLLTYRSDEPGDQAVATLDALRRQQLATQLDLAPLTADEGAAWLRSVTAARLRADQLRELWDLAGGNPLFLEELAHLVATSADLFDGAGGDQRLIARLPRTIQHVVQRRLHALRPETQSVLAIAAVIGRRFDFDLLASISGHDEAALTPLLREAVEHHLVAEPQPGVFEFHHELTRLAVSADLLARERQALHQHIADALDARIPSPGDSAADHMRVAAVAYHAFEGQQWDRVVDYATRAGERALELASPRAAIVQLSRAIHGEQQLNDRPSPRLLTLRATARDILGDFDGARRDLDAAIAAARRATEIDLEWEAQLALGMLWAARDYEPTAAAYRRALELAEQRGDPLMLARSLNHLGNWHANRDEPSEAWRLHAQALGLAERSGDDRAVAETLDLLGQAQLMGDHVADGLETLDRARRLAEQLGNKRAASSILASVSTRFGSHELWATPLPQLPESPLSEAEQSLALARELEWRAGEAYALTALAATRGVRGELGPALDLAAEALAIAREIEHDQWTIVALITLGALHIELLLNTLAREQLDEALMIADGLHSRPWQRIALAFAARAYAPDRLAPGAERLDEAIEAATAPDTVAVRSMRLARGELALLDDPERALAIARSLLTSREPVIPRVWRLEGEALTRLDRPADAIPLLETALDAATYRGWRPEARRLHRALARGHDRLRDAAAASRHRDEAAQLLESIATSVDDPEQRTAFFDRARGEDPASAYTGDRPAGLTPRELEVLTLVADGLSNPEIAERLVIDKRTVESHVGRILGKTGSTSRTQAVRWAIRHGLTSEGT